MESERADEQRFDSKFCREWGKELSSASQSGTLTVAGSTTEPGNDVTSVSVNGSSANEYADGTFAADGFAPTNGQNT